MAGMENSCHTGWPAIFKEINACLEKKSGDRKIIVVECYQGVNDSEIISNLVNGICPDLVVLSSQSMKPAEEIQNLTYPDVTDDRIFGFITRLTIADFMDPKKLETAKNQITSLEKGVILVYGTGASLIVPEPAILIYADMARWEIQLRMRRKETHNMGLENENENTETQYKRGYFVDWRVCDKLKKQLMHSWDYVLDTNTAERPNMISGQTFDAAMAAITKQPFSVVPYFDAGPWGGQWMKEKLGLDPNSGNYAWCFNCVPEENSLYLRFGDSRFEMPSINLVFKHPRQLLGDPVHGRFGDEFPIRFDFLDTMQGGNLSLQVHPLTEYIQEHFGIHYTQDESYYLMDAGEGAEVFLGLKENIDGNKMINELKSAESTGKPFDDTKFVKSWPARKHDHFLIPGGTVHCSGKDSMVLEISSTPYIFTFKLWDWGRMGMDGKPRPINIDRGAANIQWDRTESWVTENLVNRVETIAEGEGWKEERTGLHEREFIETRRHWFTEKVQHHTGKSVNVIALVEGDEVVVESPANAFEPFIVRYAEVFIVPASVGEYTIKPSGSSIGKECGTVKAYVRI